MRTNIKKIIVACLLAMTMVLTACSRGVAGSNDKITIVCTLFPQYDWVSTLQARC